jgi:hypothetical protein
MREENGLVNVSQLLSEYAKILNKAGPDSQDAEDFVSGHGGNSEFVRLARLSAALKRALMPTAPNPVVSEEVGQQAGKG